MKIGIDISQIVYGTGVSVYTKNLVENLTSIDKENEYILFGGSLRKLDVIKSFINGLSGRVIGKTFPIPPRLADFLWNRLHVLYIEQLTGNLDVFHSSDWSQPPSHAFKVTTVHDLAPFVLPKLTPPAIVSVHTARFKWISKEVDRVIVPTHAICDALVKMGFEEERIRVIYEAPGEKYKKAEASEIEKIKKQYNIHEDYLLAVGSGKRKNTEGTIKAFELVQAGENLKLVIVAGNSIFKTQNRGVRYITEYLDEETLSILFSGASALVYPSFYEGFGLPILQAFACQTPVVTSNLSSMAEVADNAAILVDPNDVESISQGIKKALDAPRTWIAKGMERVKNFSWEKAARQTLEVYKEAQKKSNK